mgnify:CR=1 FL=1
MVGHPEITSLELYPPLKVRLGIQQQVRLGSNFIVAYKSKSKTNNPQNSKSKKKTAFDIDKISPQNIKILRAIDLADEGFSRTGLGVTMDIPYGSVSRVISELENSGYIEPSGSVEHFDAKAIRETGIENNRINYSNSMPDKVTSKEYIKKNNWSFIKEAMKKR